MPTAAVQAKQIVKDLQDLSSEVSSLDQFELREVLFAQEEAQRCLAALKVQITQRSAVLHRQGSKERPQDLLARSGETLPRDIRNTVEIAETVSANPELSKKLSQIPASNLSAVVSTLKKLDENEKSKLDMKLVAKEATQSPVTEFANKLRDHVVDTVSTRDAMHRKQRAASEVRHWFNTHEQMGHIHATLDPLRYEQIAKVIDKTTSQLAYHRQKHSKRLSNQNRTRQASNAVRKDANLAAEAFCSLIAGPSTAKAKLRTTTGRPSGAELIIVVDHETLKTGINQDSVCRTENGTPVSEGVLNRALCDAVYKKVELDKSGTPINVGRKYRTATDSQWAAVKASHSTCAWTNCDTRLSWCQLHHIKYWRNGGKTDLDNLVPLCSAHHHYVHDDGWEIELLKDRSLKIKPPGA